MTRNVCHKWVSDTFVSRFLVPQVSPSLIHMPVKVLFAISHSCQILPGTRRFRPDPWVPQYNSDIHICNYNCELECLLHLTPIFHCRHSTWMTAHVELHCEMDRIHIYTWKIISYTDSLFSAHQDAIKANRNKKLKQELPKCMICLCYVRWF